MSDRFSLMKFGKMLEFFIDFSFVKVLLLMRNTLKLILKGNVNNSILPGGESFDG